MIKQSNLTPAELANLNPADFAAYLKANKPARASVPSAEPGDAYVLIADVGGKTAKYAAGLQLAFVRQFPKARTRAFFQVKGVVDVIYVPWCSVVAIDSTEEAAPAAE